MSFNERTKGFTLIELLVVVSIIAIASAASIPMGLAFLRNYNISGAANNIGSQMQKARSQAVKLNTQRGVLLNFNYPEADMYQWTSLDPNPMTGASDGGVYPDFNPKNYDEGMLVFGTVPDVPFNTDNPDPANGVMSPHRVPFDLQQISFAAGTFNALLFRSDGSVRAVDSAGASGGAGVLTPAGLDWMLTIRDSETDLTRVVIITRNGRITVQENP